MNEATIGGLLICGLAIISSLAVIFGDFLGKTDKEAIQTMTGGDG